MTDAVVEAAGPVHAAVKAVLKFRPGYLSGSLSVRPSGTSAGADGEVTFQTAEVLEKAAALKWYNEAPDGSGFVYAGAPGRWD